MFQGIAMTPIVKPSPAEQLTKLIEEGRFADYSSSTADCPANGAEWGEERTIRGYFVFSLAVGINSSVNGKGIWIRGAKIIDGLDFRGCEIPHTVWLENCYIEGGIDLSDVSIHSMILTGCYIGGTAKDRGNLHGIIANRLHCRGSLLLNNGFTVNSEAQLSDAHIGGVLQCAGGKFHNGLSAIRLTIEGSVSLADTFYVKGIVQQPRSAEISIVRVGPSRALANWQITRPTPQNHAGRL
jgi:hypothetical protein